jgi:hypothetical protein
MLNLRCTTLRLRISLSAVVSEGRGVYAVNTRDKSLKAMTSLNEVLAATEFRNAHFADKCKEHVEPA